MGPTAFLLLYQPIKLPNFPVAPASDVDLILLGKEFALFLSANGDRSVNSFVEHLTLCYMCVSNYVKQLFIICCTCL